MADISAVKELTDKLENGMKDLFESDKYAAYLQTMSRFHRYSTRNTLLIHMQMPTATRCAGYNDWKNKFKRQVKKGEKGIRIFAPMPFVVKEELAQLDPVTKQPIIGTDGQPVMEEYIKFQSARFKVVPVFDISQTDGEPLPELVEALTGDVARYELFMDALRAVSPLSIAFEDMPTDTDGACHFGDRIAIRNGMSEIQTVSAVIHEIAHAKLHDLQIVKESGGEPKDRRTEEVEAESISYAICQYYGIETGANSFGYLAEWSKSRELKELNASLDIIRKTVAELLDGIDEQYRTLAKERGIDLSAPVSSAEQMAINLNQESAAQELHPILADYARAKNDLLIGSNVLMMPVFADGNFNRENKRIRVKVEEPIGKYQLFSHDEQNDNVLYFMTVSGRVERISSYFRDDWDEEKRKYVSHHPTEAELDEIIPQITERFERNMADPTEWALYQDAAVVNRLDECEAHNIPVRQLREDERKQREAEAERERQEEKHQMQEKFDARVDEIAGAIGSGKTISVSYDEDKFDGKNPVLDLFKLYGINIPLRTQGWVNTGLAEITDGSYRYYKSKHKGDSTTFGVYLKNLRDAINLTPIEQLRASNTNPDNAEKEAKKTVSNNLYEALAAMFPQAISGEYSYLRLESDGFEPLSIEWIGGNRISIMHTYTMNGDLMYDPMMTFEVDRESQTMTATEYEMSMPPLYQRVDKDGSGISVDGNGREQRLRNLRMSLDGFASEWFGNIAQQGFIPVRANMIIDDEETQITFDKDGNPITPEPEHQPGYEEWSEPATEDEPPYIPGTGTPSDDVDAFLPQKAADNTLEHKLHDRFAELFPQFMNGEYSSLVLEAEHAKPLTLEWVFGDLISISHKYELNGEPTYEPLVMLSFNSMEKTLTASSLELSEPPRKDIVYTEPGKPNIEMQQNINNFMAQWLDRIAEQGFMPVHATLWNEGKIDDVDIAVRFDNDGNIIVSEPETHEPVNLVGQLVYSDSGEVVDYSSGDLLLEAYKAAIYTLGAEGVHYKNVADGTLETQLKALCMGEYGEDYPEPNLDIATQIDLTLPDPSIGLSEMNLYGYDYAEMLPLLQARAVELFDSDHCIYLLYPDNTESMALDRDEILNHDGLCGIERADWEKSPVYAAQLAIASNAEGKREADLLYGDGNRFGIYQIKDGIDEARNFRFAPMRELEALGLSVDRANYELVYIAPFSERIEFLSDRYPVLNKLYEQFNLNHPADFTGHSLSVSDIVVLKCNGDISSHFVDSVGFVEVDTFLGEESHREAAKSEAERTDPTLSQVGNRSDAPTVAELKNTVKSGGVISLTDLSRAVNAERKPPLSKGKPSLLGKLEQNKQRAAQQGQSETRKPDGLEV